MEERNIPTVELELMDVTGPQAVATRPAVVVTRPVAAQAPLSTTVAPPAEPQGPSPAAAPQDPEQPAAAPGGEADVTGAEQPAWVPASNTAGGAPGTPAGAGAQSSAGSPSAPALGTPISAPVLIPPTARTEILPTYPRSARRSGLEGVVKVAVVVDETGKVTSAEVLSTSGHGVLDQAAVEAVRRTAFDPALQDGRPIACRIVIPVRFKLAAKTN